MERGGSYSTLLRLTSRWHADTAIPKANQLGNEESIEAIIRKRTHDGKVLLMNANKSQSADVNLAFRSRCPYFAPAVSDPVGKGWWDLAESGRGGKGPDLS